MKKTKFVLRSGNDIFWGLILISLAVLVIVSELGLTNGVDFWTIVFTTVFSATLIKGIIRIDFGHILFSLAFLCIVWDDFLGIEAITPWPVLFAALLGTIGASRIIERKKGVHIANYYESMDEKAKRYEYKYYESTVENPDSDVQVEMENNENVKCSVSFGNLVKYIDSDNLKSVSVLADFSSAAIYLDKAVVPNGQLAVKLDSSFSTVHLYIPRDWKVINKMGNTFSGLKEKNSSSGADVAVLYLEGNADFSKVKIVYV